MNELNQSVGSETEQHISVLAPYFYPGEGIDPDRIILPDIVLNNNSRRDDIDKTPVFIDPINRCMGIIQRWTMDSVYEDSLKKYFRVVRNCQIFGYDWGNGGREGIVAYAGRNEFSEDGVLFVSKKEDFTHRPFEVCFGRYSRDDKMNRILEDE